ncbi:hypothetical protein GUJ93_ZPchr0013g34157 [Zizania palustris]|uniref:Uncharacterized protein n=1 Tax=Zizania palustris TaxID=103762 RepID=A0A8J5WXX9_ZIZPA|nr:hypothetical protein GUJ93_ZPchr0013g34157 [Zizania palustris]
MFLEDGPGCLSPNSPKRNAEIRLRFSSTSNSSPASSSPRPGSAAASLRRSVRPSVLLLGTARRQLPPLRRARPSAAAPIHARRRRRVLDVGPSASLACKVV